jgi:hypothetical protein
MYNIALQILEELFKYYVGIKLEVKLSGKRQKIILYNRVYKHIFIDDEENEEYIYNSPKEVLDSDELIFNIEDLIELINKDKLKFEVRLV